MRGRFLYVFLRQNKTNINLNLHFKKMKPINFILSLSVLAAACTGVKENAPLVTGRIAASDSTMITTYYDINGDTYVSDIYTDSVGNFTFDPEIPNGTDLTLYINGTTYGVRIENGTSVNIAIDSLGQATFDGDNAAESRWLTECFKGYNSQRYKHIKARDGEYNPQKYLDMIESARTTTEAILPEVANDSLRAYYDRLGKQFYNRIKADIILYDYVYNKKDSGAEYPHAEIAELKIIDPNSDEVRRSGALFDWVQSISMPRTDNFMQTITAMCDSVDTKITNPANKRMLINNFCDMLFTYNTPVQQIREFMTSMNDRISSHQIEVMEAKIKEIESRTKDGDKIPCDPVIVAPDGSKKTLTEACEGKIAYIDMWATWCGPCCAQIPYMEKMAEYYKNNDKVICISISCDEDLDAWQRKLAQDKPEWPQYVFQGESGQRFLTAMGVTGIPRFIIINPDMTLARIDAPRPQSDDKVKAIIDELLAK